jgi:PDZ domain
MSSPRHLWSGDWRLESDAVAEELAKRRAPTEEPAETRELPPPRSRTSAATRASVWLRTVRHRLATRSARGPRARQSAGERFAAVHAGRGRQLRVVLVAALVALLSAGGAYAAVSFLVGSGDQSSATANGAPVWLGIDMGSLPFGGGGFQSGAGAVVSDVVPGGPAAGAGLEPGDVITQIGNQPVGTPSDVESAIAGMHTGQQVEIQYDRGPMTYTTQATLAARPAGYP